jgi:hypothetical protein
MAARLVAEAFVIKDNKKATRTCIKTDYHTISANHLEWLTPKEVAKRAGESKVCYVRRIRPRKER